MTLKEETKSEKFSLEFTGERYVPELEGHIALEHLHRYAIARELAVDKVVLDIACGEGYGSNSLADVAFRVIGVDLDEETITHARNKYLGNNLIFRQGSASEIPVESNSIDLVVSFETIEHHDKHVEMLAEIKRVLKPDGVLLISSPDKLEYSDKPDYSNPFHIKELYLEEFKELLNKYFRNHSLYGQRIIYGSGVFPSRTSKGGSTFYRYGDEGFRHIGTPNPIYDIAIASDRELQFIGGSIFEQPLDDSEIIRSWASAVSDRDEKITAANREVDQLNSALANRKAELNRLRGALAAWQSRFIEAESLQNQLAIRLNAVQCSAASQLARPLAWAEKRWPRIVTACAMLPKVLWWTATLNLSRLSLARTVQKIRRAGLFEERWYVQHNPDVVAAGGNPLLHWLLHGWKERRDPHPLFNVSWYLEQNPDMLVADVNPLLHYLDSGAIQGRDPHPLFDSSWYLDQYPDVAGKGVNPLVHYLQCGAAEGRDPHPLFETAWYRQHNPDVSASGLNPLVHYLEKGAAEGRDPGPEFKADRYLAENPRVSEEGINPLEHYMRTGADDKPYASRIASPAVYGLDVTDIDYEIIKTPAALVGEEIVVFVTYLPQAALKQHTAHYLRTLKAAGFTVILMVAVDELPDEIGELNESAVDGLIVRLNHGYDFSAWAHAMKIWPDLWGAQLLLFANDSVYGPAESGAFSAVIERIRKSEADVLGLTESCERGVWHIQSYFVALKPRALGSVVCQEFWKNVRSLPSKQSVIDSYELGFVSSLKHAGLNCEVLFPHQQLVTSTGKNPTLFQWRQLLDNGFPFVKVQVLRDDIPGVDARNWQVVLGRNGFPVSAMESHLRTFESRGRASVTAGVNRMSTERLRSSGKLCQENLNVSFIGPWNYASGLGVASRGYLSALWHSKLRVNLHPIHRPFHIHGRVAPMLDVNDFDGPSDICIVHLNPDAWPSLLDDTHRRVMHKARYRVGLWVWELPEVPHEWVAYFKDVDAVWCPSEYCRSSFVSASVTPVSVLPHVVTAPYDLIPPNLSEKLGLPAQRRFILYVFDGASYLVRKNPHALVRAFAASGLAQRGWSLILKTKNLFDIAEEGQRLEQMVQSTPEVYLVNRVLSPRDHHGILALSQVYASPHASEGFGLTIAEAMAAGKVVVATDHGGSRDFLDASCGFPVKWSEQVLERDHGHYRRGGVWAAVDEEDLARALVEAAAASMDPALTVPRAAANRIEAQLSAQAVADRMHGLCQELAG